MVPRFSRVDCFPDLGNTRVLRRACRRNSRSLAVVDERARQTLGTIFQLIMSGSQRDEGDLQRCARLVEGQVVQGGSRSCWQPDSDSLRIQSDVGLGP